MMAPIERQLEPRTTDSKHEIQCKTHSMFPKIDTVLGLVEVSRPASRITKVGSASLRKRGTYYRALVLMLVFPNVIHESALVIS